MNDLALIKFERCLIEVFTKKSIVEKSLAKQKTRIQCLKEGDGNTNFFFKYLKVRRNINHITK